MPSRSARSVDGPARRSRSAPAGARHRHRRRGHQASAAAAPLLPRTASPRGGLPLTQLLVGSACVGLGARLLLSIRARAQGSVGALRERGGALSSGQWADGDVAEDEASIESVLGRVNLVRIEGPSEEEILAARMRRAQQLRDDEEEGPAPGGGMDALAVPEDHPFAVREAVDPRDAELLQERLRIQRGAPLQDLDGTRGYGEGDDEGFNAGSPAAGGG